MNLNILLLLPLSVEAVPPEGILIGVSLIVPLTIRTFKEMRVWLTLLYFETRWIHLLIHLVALPKFVVVLRFVRAITFDVFGTLNST